MKFINLYHDAQLTTARKQLTIHWPSVFGICLLLAAYTGYLLLDQYRAQRSHTVVATTYAPALERLQRMQQYNEQQTAQQNTTVLSRSPFTILSGLKSSQTYLQRAALTQATLTIELYFPSKQSIATLLAQCAAIAGVTAAQLVTIRSHTPEQRALTIALTLGTR